MINILYYLTNLYINVFVKNITYYVKICKVLIIVRINKKII